MSRLQRKFFRSFLCLGVIPVLIVAVVIVSSAYRLHRRDVALVAENLVNQQGAEIARFFEAILNELRIVVGYSDYAPPTLENQTFLLRGLSQANPAIQDLSFVCTVAGACPVGMETARVQADNDTATLRNLNGDPAFETARQGRSYFGPVRFTEAGPVVHLVEPAVNRKNQVIGLVSAEVSLAPLGGLLARAKLGQTGFLYLLDADGRIIVQSLPAEASAQAGKLQISGQPFQETGNVLRYRQVTPQFRWTLGADWPLVEVNAIIQETMAKVALVLLLVIAVVFGLSIIIARELLQPIQALIVGARAVGQGKLDQQVAIKTDDELQDLADQFNKMTTDLREVERLREAKLRAEYLEQALAKERELSAIKDKFMTTVSHQLNTPLAVMNYAIQSIPFGSAQGGPTNSSPQPDGTIQVSAEAVAGIRASHHDLLEEVEDTLFLSDIGFTYIPKHRERVSLRDLVTTAVIRLMPRATERRIIIRSAPTETFEVSGERLTLARAVANLIDNAITYSKEGGEVTIELKHVEGNIVMSVRDTGIGIPADDQALVGKEIFRAKNAVVGKNVGTGMGVLIARIVAAGHGGKLWFTSQENIGTTFFLQLPVELGSSPAAPSSAASTLTLIQPGSVSSAI